MATTTTDRIVQIAYDLQDAGAYMAARSVAACVDERDKYRLALMRALIELEYCTEQHGRDRSLTRIDVIKMAREALYGKPE